MRQDIDRIKGVSLEHIDYRIEKTNTVLLNIEEIFIRKFDRLESKTKNSKQSEKSTKEIVNKHS